MGSVTLRLVGREGDALRPDEIENLVEASVPVLDKYFPDSEGGPELALLLTLGAVAVGHTGPYKRPAADRPRPRPPAEERDPMAAALDGERNREE